MRTPPSGAGCTQVDIRRCKTAQWRAYVVPPTCDSAGEGPDCRSCRSAAGEVPVSRYCALDAWIPASYSSRPQLSFPQGLPSPSSPSLISSLNPPCTLPQLSGLLLFTAGFLIAWRSLPGLGNGSPTGGTIGRAHQVMGTAVFGLTCAQVRGMTV